MRRFLKYDSINQVEKDFDSDEIYGSIPQNVLVAFESGDIAYILAHNSPIRKHNRPYTGCRVLDGTTSEDDWVGFVKPRDLPRVINPKKGYIVTANNRQMPDNVISDIGATISSTIRAQRITELIEAKIAMGHKFDYQDMLKIQNDTVDMMAREMMPKVAKLSQKMIGSLTKAQGTAAEQAFNRLATWYG